MVLGDPGRSSEVIKGLKGTSGGSIGGFSDLRVILGVAGGLKGASEVRSGISGEFTQLVTFGIYYRNLNFRAFGNEIL